MEALDRLRKDNPEYVAFDTETTGVGFFDIPFAVTVAWFTKDRQVRSYFFDIAEVGEYKGGEQHLAEEILKSGKTLIAHNFKFDAQKLQLCGVFEKEERPAFHDTEGMLHLLDEHSPKRLKQAVKRLLNIDPVEEEELKSARRKLKLKKSDGYHKLPRDILIPYAVKDAEYTLLLFDYLLPRLSKHADLTALYASERELTWCLLDCEWEGMGVDEDYVDDRIRYFSDNIFNHELRIRNVAGKEDFNPNSNPQIRAYFESKGIVEEKYNKPALLEIEDPMSEALLDYRKDTKILSTYFMAMKDEVDEKGILHPHFRQYKPVTGRMSSGKAED